MEVVVGIIAKMLVFEYLIPSNELLSICQSNSDIPSITITTNLSLWSCIYSIALLTMTGEVRLFDADSFPKLFSINVKNGTLN